MHTSFLTGDDDLPSADVSLQASIDPVSGKEFIKVLVIGSRQGVIKIIHTLHRLRFAEGGEWSQLMPYGNSGEMMSILRRQIFLP